MKLFNFHNGLSSNRAENFISFVHQCSALFINVLVLFRAACLHNNRVRRRTVESIISSCWPAGDDLRANTKAKDCYYCVGITAVPQLMIHQCKVMSKYFHHFLISFLLQTLTFNIHVQPIAPLWRSSMKIW